MCSANDDMTNPALADATPAEVWCCECDQPSIHVWRGKAYCDPHLRNRAGTDIMVEALDQRDGLPARLTSYQRTHGYDPRGPGAG